MRFRHDEEETPGIEMAPMIDCVFLLLIFFIVAATIRKKHMELPIQLPPSTSMEKPKTADDDTVVVSIFSAEGQVQYALTTVGERTRTGGGAREYLSLDQLRRQIESKASELPDRSIRVDADVGVRYGDVMQVVDHLEINGFSRIGLRTQDR